MNDIKSVFASGGVWTAIFGLVAAVLIALGFLPEGYDVAGAYAAVLAVVSGLGGWFRIRATKQLVVAPPTTQV